MLFLHLAYAIADGSSKIINIHYMHSSNYDTWDEIASYKY